MRNLVSFLFFAVSANSFSPRSGTFRPRTDSLSTHAILPEHVDFAALDQLHHLASASSSWLADNADAISADVVDAAKEDIGWWKSYLNIFKAALLGVHNAVDGPLQNMGITQTWGISIAIFTAGCRSLLIPLSVQQSKGAEYMKALKPYQDEIKEKFKDNQEAQNRAIAKLFEDAKQNPLAGCLLSLAQLPIFLGLYRGVRLLAMDGQLDEPFLWIPSLQGPVSAPDYRGMEWLTQGWTPGLDGGLPTPSLGWETTLAFLVMPVILVLGQTITMKVLTPATDTANMSEEEKNSNDTTQNVLKFLPLLIGFFSLQVPAGLTIYWFTSNLFSLSQSLLVKAYYQANPPKIELPEYWDSLDDMDSMSAEERRKASEAGFRTGPSWDDILAEANFHYVVKREPLRAESDAWKRVEQGSRTVPSELASWVSSSSSSSKMEPTTASTAASA